jgi:hypothetical protein
VSENSVPLAFCNASPDAIRFPKPQRVFEALHDDRALGTKLFCLAFASLPTEATITVAVEEH